MPKKNQHKQASNSKQFGFNLGHLLRKGTSPFAQMLSALPLAVFCKDVQDDFRFFYWNDNAETLTGISRDLAIGKRDFDIWPEYVAKAIRADDLLVVNTRRTIYKPELKLGQKNGAEVWSRSWKVPIIDENGNVTALFGLAQDITEMKKSETASAEAARQLKSVIVNAPGMFFQFTFTSAKERKFLFVSRRALDIFGISDIDLINDSARFYSLVHEDDAAELEHTMMLSASDLSSWVWEGRIWHLQEERWIRFAADPHLIPDGSIIWDGFAIDITLQKRQDESLRAHHARLANVTRMAAVGQLAGGLAHELNTPLSTIFLTSELLRLQVNSPHANFDELGQVYDIIDTIDSAADQMSKVINNLRSISRSGSAAHQKSVDLRELISQSVTLCAQRLKYSGVEVHVAAPDEPVYVPSAASNIGQVLFNLLNNSIDAISGSSDAWIRIELTTDDTSTQVRVTDCGPGIRAHIVSRLFEPFFTTKDIVAGVGLSLSISKEIMKLHGGELFFDKGARHTTFVLSLPSAVPAASAA